MDLCVSAMSEDTTPGPEEMRARRSRTKRIGKQLRQLYDEVTQEDIPDDFLQLLEEADSKRSTRESRQSDDAERDTEGA